MLNLSSTIIGLFFVAFIAFLAPFLVDIIRLRFLPAVVIEIVAGIIIGPQGLHWVRADDFLRILSEMGLCYLLFLAGLEIELDRLRGRLLAVVGVSFLLSFGIALLIGFSLNAIEQKTSPLFVAVILASTSLGIVIPILKDAGESSSEFGQLAIAGATVGEFCSIILLSLFFSDESSSPVSRFALLVVFFLLILLFSLAVFHITPAISAALVAAGLLSVIIYPLIALLLLCHMPGREKPLLLAEPI